MKRRQGRLSRPESFRERGLPGTSPRCALFLASTEASYVPGVVIPVEGGIASGHPTPKLEA